MKAFLQIYPSSSSSAAAARMLLKSNICLLLESNKKTPNSLSSFHVKLPSIFCSKQPMPLMGDPLKPRGFGEGKVYDTSLEDKLLQPQQGKLSKHKVSEPEVVPNGIRVRLVNLPKKKNIHRDLGAAFKPFPGIINIIPAVSGNEKTREPVCKGFAFVDFKSEKQANRFVDILSTQPITFGKVQKQIRCEIMKSSSSNQAPVKHRIESPLPVLKAPMAVNSKPADANAAFDMLKIGGLATNDNNFGKSYNVVQEPEAGSESLDKQKKVTRAKKKVDNSPKLSLPGSANRLKTKEKALLSGVFVKYAGKSSDEDASFHLHASQIQNRELQFAMLEEIYRKLALFPIPPPIELDDLPYDVMLSRGLGMYDMAQPLPLFTGVNPDKWLRYAERYFEFYAIHGLDRFTYLADYFVCKAAN
ncbi:hypothetical protein E3N88_37280 [Mikania micrantha]|uniref:RRM domain-containing protein n=1 Tax=Mikania micrantha TaxID=192012 RepID=A0A5N6LQQ0_9ASTR|nr:hypothetical protein E3N88_37280 [Mikania micrantha]